MTKANKSILPALGIFILVMMLFFLNNLYLKKRVVVINADGKGYYEYLPAIFIYNDLSWKYLDTLVTEHYNHKEHSGVFNLIEGKKVNKYFVGTSLLELPFFGLACLYDYVKGRKIDGYSKTYQDAISFAALFYLWLGLLYLYKFFRRLKFNLFSIFTTLVVVVFSTSIVFFTGFDPSYSHIFSFSSICAFLYYSYMYYESKNIKYFFISSLILSLIFLIRPVNVIILLIVLFYFISFKEFIQFITHQFRSYKYLIIFAISLSVLLSFLQLLIWYLQSGSFFIEPYKGEGFNFLSPKMFKVLFSYKKGLFVYSPILFLMLLGGGYTFIKDKKHYKLLVLVSLLTITTYVISSWWCWYYGMSYGMRPFVEFLPIFAIFAIHFFNKINKIGKTIAIGISIVFIFVNIIQIDQYYRYILHWDLMDKESYWRVFLKTDKKYEGLLWREKGGSAKKLSK